MTSNTTSTPVYRTAEYVILAGLVHTLDPEGDFMGTQTIAEFKDSSMYALWERTPYADFVGTDGMVETYQLDITQ